MAGHWQKSDSADRKSTNRRVSVDERINAHGSSQRQLLRLEQLREIGLGSRGVQLRAEEKRLFRLHAGVYSLHPAPYPPFERWLAAVYACGAGSLLSDWPAAHLLGMVENAPLIAEITNATGSGRGREGIVVHRRAIDRRDVSRFHGIPCTSAARTIIDCASEAGAAGTEELIMAADSRQILNRNRLAELLVEHRGRPGIGHVRALIGDGPVVTRSPNERRLFSICRDFGVPRPLVNHEIRLGERIFYADFCWPELRLIVEAGSWRWHGGRSATERDADRDQLLSIAGWKVVHFTRDQIKKRREETGRRLVALTRGADR